MIRRIRRTRNVALMAGVATYTLFRARRRALRPMLKLPPVRYNVGVERNLRVPMRDGITLAADHHFPRARGDYPTILIRTPYGRAISGGIAGVSEGFKAQRFAERGYHVVVQDVRGRFDSEGEFEPFVNEREDGLATLEWLAAQPWFNGKVALWGQSYLGFCQWAVAAEAPDYVKAIMPAISASQFRSLVFPDGAYALNTALRWAYLSEFVGNKRGWRNWRTLPHTRRLIRGRIFERAYQHLPLQEADQVVAGRTIAPFQESLTTAGPDSPRWEDVDFSRTLAKVTMPTHLIAGWYDALLREMLADYAGLRRAGHNPYLTIGPWSHIDQRVQGAMLREGVQWFDAHLKGDKHQLREKPVRVYVMGAKTWRDFDEWPPPSVPTRYYLQADGWLALDQPELERSYTHYHYDPSNPTPSLGGTTIFPPSGALDQSSLEARADVLVFTSALLLEPVEIMGAVRLELYVRSNRAYTDFVGRLCDVDPDGRSVNICDGLFRIQPGKGEPQPDGSLKIVVEMWSTAYRFEQYHRIRLHVCSGAHPRWSRNLGTGEPFHTGTTMLTAAQTVYHDTEHLSALVLPVTEG